MKSYILIVDHYPFPILIDINPVRCPDPPLPKYTIDPCKPNLWPIHLFHANPDLLCRSQSPLVIPILGFLDPKLLCIPQLLPLKLPRMRLLIDPLKCRILNLTLGNDKL